MGWVVSLFEEEYKRRYVFGADYGTGDFKYGPITQGEKPLVVENRGYFPEPSLVSKIMGVEKEVVVGRDVAQFLESGAELLKRMVYPMKSGVVGRDDAKAWKVLKELTWMVLEEFKPRGFGFNGFYVVAALAATAPRYMYEKFFEIYRELAEKSLVKAVTIIPQPLAVAIAHKATSCVVVEGGHGNTQVTPISRAPIREAIIALNRGGADANAITAEILKDAGYGDLAKEEAVVRRAKEQLGLLPLELDRAVAYAKQNPANVRKKVKIAGTRITIDLGELSWTRFLIAEYVFNPSNPVFESYFKRGMPRPADVKIGEQVFYGMTSIADSVIEAVEKCPVELQPHLYSQIILSGGNMSWTSPPELRDVAVDAPTRVRFDLVKRGVENLNIRLTEDPQYAVWRGCIVYGYAVPADYSWAWETMEGWMRFKG
jgi:crenactin